MYFIPPKTGALLLNGIFCQGSITYVFPCGRWLARNEEDGAIERELVPQKATKELIGRDGQVKNQDVKLRDKLKGQCQRSWPP
jgi:hypothetical protein